MKDISLLIARILLKVAPKEEVDSINKWKNRSDKNISFIENLETYCNSQVVNRPADRQELAKQRLVARLNSTGEVHRQKRLLPFITKIAASIIIALSIAGLSIFIASKTNLFYEKNWVEVSTEVGQQSKVELPDGSLVWLNAETNIKYQPDKKNRKVKLSGEAYFEVTHAKNRPFVVETEQTEVKVLGTKFNVSHYPDSKITEAALLSGKITLSISKSNEVLVLKPGEKVIYDSDKNAYSKEIVPVQNEILWTEGILFFENERFSELIQKLERYYGVTIIYEKHAFDNIHYTGSINKLTINKVLEFINLTIPIIYEIDNKTIKLSLKK